MKDPEENQLHVPIQRNLSLTKNKKRNSSQQPSDFKIQVLSPNVNKSETESNNLSSQPPSPTADNED